MFQVKSAASDNHLTSNSAQMTAQVNIYPICPKPQAAILTSTEVKYYTAFYSSQSRLTSCQLAPAMVLREAVTMRCELFVKPIQKCLLSYLAFMWLSSKTNCMYQMWMIQAMSCAPQLPTSTSPQKKSARMEVVWILDQILQWRRPLPKTWSILHLKVFLMLKLLSNYGLFTRLSQLPQTTTCLQILA